MTTKALRIVSLAPVMTDVVIALGLGGSLVGVSGSCSLPKELLALPRLTEPGSKGKQPTLCDEEIDLAAFKAAQPTVVLISPALDVEIPPAKKLAAQLATLLGVQVQCVAQQPATLAGVYELFGHVAEELQVGSAGAELAGRMKAQIMDWARSFNDRTRNKRVTFLSGVDPFRLGGRWIPDMIAALSGISQSKAAGEPARTVSWDEIVAFRPDVIVVAPEDRTLDQAAQLLTRLEQLPHWEELPAVKRGEVIFADGSVHFHRPGPKLVEAMGVLVSGIGGLESGYITPRDSFRRLRYVELHRKSATKPKEKRS